MNMKVCYFGSYKDREHNRIIIKGLRENGVLVKECNIQMEDLSDDINKRKLIRKSVGKVFCIKFLLGLILNYTRLVKKHAKCGEYDVMVVGFPGYYVMPLAKLISKMYQKPLVYDAFISVYDTLVLDREVFSKKSFFAKLFHFMDYYSCKSADLVLVESYEDKKYFSKEFKIPQRKFVRSFVGGEDDVFYPKPKKASKHFNVVFYGTYIPLQGIEYIIKAAKLLEKNKNIKFKIVGSGQDYKKIIQLAKELGISNIEFVTEWVEYSDLPKLNAEADVCLGIFGLTTKSKKYIPNKAFQALAMKKPLITGNSPAAREILVTKKDAILCKMGNGRDLASSILLLKNDPKLREKISKNGYKTFKENFSPKAIGKVLKNNLEGLLDS